MATLTPTPEELHHAADALQDATRKLYAGLKEQSAARFVLDEAKAQLLVSGIEGKNAEVREAQLRLALAPEHEQLERASVSVSEGRATLECARAGWDCLRYEVRLLALTGAAELPF